jgi:lipopolysaccharide biosynthesis glycosyltransferase
MLFFTLCHINQLPEAHILGDSIQSYHPNADFRIGLIDKKDRIPRNFKVRYAVIEVSTLKISHFEEMAKQYTWDELSFNCKPFFAKYFLEQSDKIVYFDCTSTLHNPIDFIKENLNSHTIIIVPQLLHAGVHPDEKQILNTGIFHSGFMALRKADEAFNFLDWWGNNTAKKGYIDLCKGLNADQLWLEHVPNFYTNVLILKHEGLNIGIWNLPERQIDKAQNTSNSQPIISFNFKGMKYPVEYKKEISKYPISKIIPFYGLPNPKKEKIGKAIATNIRKFNSIIDKIIDLI